ncbi:MAG: general secretion pathway protein GspE [Myxococcaceae bacterium]|nr:general secretion pathway protein GspE [Myxococcaceae bacterium]
MGFVDEESMTVALSRQLQLPLVDLDTAGLPQDVVHHLRVDMAERYGVFPIAGDPKARTITVATSDPTNVEQAQEIAFHTGMKVQFAVATGSSIDRAIRRYYYGENTVASDTTTPKKLGLSEPEFAEADLARNGQTARAPGTTLVSAEAAALVEQLSFLQHRVGELEKLVFGQVRALRSVVELLLEKGHITREEYLARVRGRDERSHQ